MEHHDISESLNGSTVSKILTRKWVEINDSSNGQYSVTKNITFKTPMLRRNLRFYSDVHHSTKNEVFYYRFLMFPTDLVTFSEEIHNGKLHFLCSVYCCKRENIC